MTEYKGFKYQKIDARWWTLVYPSGFTTQIEAASETIVREKIDYIINNLKDPRSGDGQT